VRGKGPLQKFYDGFNKVFNVATDKYVGICRFLIHKGIVTVLLLVGFIVLTGFAGKAVPTSFLPDEDQGYMYAGVQLPDASSAQRTSAVMEQVEKVLHDTPGIQSYS